MRSELCVVVVVFLVFFRHIVWCCKRTIVMYICFVSCIITESKTIKNFFFWLNYPSNNLFEWICSSFFSRRLLCQLDAMLVTKCLPVCLLSDLSCHIPCLNPLSVVKPQMNVKIFSLCQSSVRVFKLDKECYWTL